MDLAESESESEFREAVAAWLADAFVVVDAEPTLPSGRRPDFRAVTPFETYIIEVENNGRDLGDIYTGLGQVEVYAQETGDVPVLVFPADRAPIVTFPDDIEVVTV